MRATTRSVVVSIVSASLVAWGGISMAGMWTASPGPLSLACDTATAAGGNQYTFGGGFPASPIQTATAHPTNLPFPTESATSVPTGYPFPSESPTSEPSESPSSSPSESPTSSPSESPTSDPSESPSSVPSPTCSPTAGPSPNPTVDPSAEPSGDPSAEPSGTPSEPEPSGTPTKPPEVKPPNCSEPPTKAEIEKVFEGWNAAIQNDAEKTADRYHDDAVLLSTLKDEPYKGKKNIKKYFEEFVKRQPIAKVTDREIQILGDKAAVDTGLYTFTFRDGKKPPTIDARFTFVYKVVDGKCLIISHHSSKLPSNKD